jgi:phenylacetic acid degradation operon negative regulatory protein
VRKPTAKRLILDVLLATQGKPISAKQAISACSIFEISVNNARVALVRLSAEGLIESAGRALYQLTSNAHTLADDVATWRTRSKRIRAWDGSYIVTQIKKVSRNEAMFQRTRARTLLMLGFQPLNERLYIRPNNIEESLDAVRKRLYTLGLENEAPVFQADQFNNETQKRILKLWNPRELEQTYAHFERKIHTWLDQHQNLPIEVAAKEIFLLGGTAIKHVVYDPFLPEEWINTLAREQFLSTVKELDCLGVEIWSKLWSSAEKSL